MNKTELIDHIADRTGVPKKDVGAVLDGLFVEVSRVVAKGEDKVTIPGFVSFEQVDRKERKGFNPQTGEPITIPASTAVKVTAGNKLKAYAKGTEQPPA
jgi:DNA-binding protein HU-beta